jgi:hypothetical protein
VISGTPEEWRVLVVMSGSWFGLVFIASLHYCSVSFLSLFRAVIDCRVSCIECREERKG